MKNLIKNFLRKKKLFALYSIFRTGPLKNRGWFESYVKGESVDGESNPIPWITYSSFDFISKRLQAHHRMFEFGCGNSTIWFGSKINKVFSVENNFEWFNKIKNKVSPNVHLIFEKDEEKFYRTPESLNEKYEILVIDGFDRERSLLSGIKNLTEDGIIIFDNTDRPRYTKALSYLKESGFKQIPFRGMAPILNLETETSVFYRSNNCFNI